MINARRRTLARAALLAGASLALAGNSLAQVGRGYAPGFRPGVYQAGESSPPSSAPANLAPAGLSTLTFPSSASEGTVLATITGLISGSVPSIDPTDMSNAFEVSGTNVLAGPAYPNNLGTTAAIADVIISQTDASANNSPLSTTIPVTIPAPSTGGATTTLFASEAAYTGQIYTSNTYVEAAGGALHINCNNPNPSAWTSIVVQIQKLDDSGQFWDTATPLLTCNGNVTNSGSATVTATTPIRAQMFSGIPIPNPNNVGNGTIGVNAPGYQANYGNFPYYAYGVATLAVSGNYTLSATSATSFTEVDPNSNTLIPTCSIGAICNVANGLQIEVQQGTVPFAAGDSFVIPAAATPATNFTVSVTETPS